MKKMHGNITAQLQIKTASSKNEIGEKVPGWTTVNTLTGWFDLSAGDSKYQSYNAKIQESTHVFVADYVELDSNVTSENSRLIVGGKTYDIMLIDNPMGLNYQLEISLKYTGGQ